MPKCKAAAANKAPGKQTCDADVREQMLDKTLADSFPASDPPSSIPDPCPEEVQTPTAHKAA